MLAVFSPPLGAEEVKATGRLIIPEDFKMLYVDGEKFSASLWSFGDVSLPLTIGQHNIILRYDRVFEQDEAIDRVKSGQFMLTFTVAQPVDYQLLIPPLNTVAGARHFVQELDLAIAETATQKRLPSHLTRQIEDAEFLAGFSNRKKTASPEKSNNLQQLHYWWRQASKEEQEKFLFGIGIKP